MKQHRVGSMLSEFSKGVRGRFVWAIVASTLSIVLSFLTPQIIRFTVDSIIGSDTGSMPTVVVRLISRLGGREALQTHLAVCALGVIVCAALSAVMNHFSRVSIAKGTEGLIRSLRTALFRHIQYLPFQWHTENQTGDTIQRCTSDVEVLRNFISQQLIEVVRTVILLAIALGLMFTMNTTLAVVSLLFIPLIVGYSAFFHTRIHRQFRVADEAEGDLTVKVQENLTGVRVVRAFGRERYELDEFDRKNQTFADKWIDMGYTLGLFWGVGDAASCLQMLTVICLGAFLAARGQMTLGEMLAFISYTQTMASPVRSLGRTLSEFSKATVSAERLCEILDAQPEQPSPEDTKPDLHADIVFDHVSFAYGAHEVLHDVSFTIRAGQTVGILGATGSGKSTLTYLLNRLYELPEGSGHITIGGTDLHKIDRAHLRRNVGLVLQEPFLFSKTILENITVAAPDAALDRARHAAQIAAVDESILSFRDGYDTVVGERGVTLSGGQKQRIAIARTLMMQCPILVFDDSTSAVDMETDAQIREALRENTGNATVVLISHRINTLMQADQILVLEDGRISEAGTHDELVARDGLYRRVYQMQLGQTEGGAENG
jgi:ATP-binding cassette subfamily B protein